MLNLLSTRRRHPMAGIVVVLLGLLIAGLGYSAFRPAVADSAGKTDTQLIAQGRKLFVVSCASCHGLNAEGIISKQGGQFGPPLIGVGAAAVDFQVGTGRMPMASASIQAPQKEPVMTPQEVSALAAYIASLGPGPAIPMSSVYDPTGATTAQIAQGGSFFRTNCTACHNFAGSGGALAHGGYAPSLLGTIPRHMFEAMITGPQQMPVFDNSVLTPSDKRDIIAYITDLKSAPSYGGSSLGSLGPVTEGLWGWLGGIGLLIAIATWIGNSGVRAGKRK